MKNKGYISRLIYYILKNNEETRDDWMLVVKKIHDIEMVFAKVNKTDYYNALFGGKLTNPQTISRIWRKIQEHNIELRGKDWVERQIMGGQIAIQIARGGYIQLNLFQK